VRIIVFDLKKYAIFLAALRYILVFVLIFGIISFGALAYYSSDEYIEAMHLMTEEKIIIIDAGHGGEDCGAIGVTGVYEKDLNLIIAKELGALLEAEGYAVVYTRTQDKLLYMESENIKGIRKISDLKNRCKIAKEYPNALFVSIHMNSFSNAKYSGLQVYYSPDSEESRALAATVQAKVKDSLQKENERKIKKGEGMYVLENVENTAILIECGFLTNREECEKLSEKEYQKALSFSIFCGIIDYIEMK
jgi:N-acetylmuramoyl-L-alanine amidase